MAKKKTEWIAVNERRPEYGETVLTYRKPYGIKIRTYRKSAFMNQYGDYGDWTCFTYWPTHWMPLPDAPRDER